MKFHARPASLKNLFLAATVSMIAGIIPTARACAQTEATQIVPEVDQPSTFLVAPSLSLSSAPVSVAVGDLNQDGKPDMIIAEGSSGKIAILLGAGHDSFHQAVQYTAGPHPVSVIAVDINGDGKPDVVVTDSAEGTVSVFLGNGDGTLQPRQTYSVGGKPLYVAAGDFNGDGHIDLVVADRERKSLSILLHNGAGGFQEPITTVLRKAPTWLVVADINGDGHADALLGNDDGTLSVLLGQRGGSLHATQDITVGAGAISSLALKDLNRDGKPDLVATVAGQPFAYVLTGKGDGAFASPASFASDDNAESILLADADEDGIADLITTNQTSHTFSVLKGNGDATFKAAVHFIAGARPLFAVAGDFNADGHIDLAIIHQEASQGLTVAFGHGDGTFQAPRAYKAELQPSAIDAGDLNGDGKMDLVVANRCGSDPLCSGPGSLNVFLAGSAEGYSLTSSYTLGAKPVAVKLADVNSDGILDIVALNRNDHTASVLLGAGDGSFQRPFDFSLSSAPVALVTGDFNKDGRVDLAIVSDCGSATCAQPGELEILSGTGDGSFHETAAYPVGYAATSIAAADLNHDGSLDLVVANGCGQDSSCKGPGTATVLLGSRAGSFVAQPDISLPQSPSSIALADLSGQGTPDLLVTSATNGTLSVLRGSGDGTFKDATPYRVGGSPRAIVVADFNGDGRPDVALANVDDATASVLFGKGDGTLQASAFYSIGAGPEALARVDGVKGYASLAAANGRTGVSGPGSDIAVLTNLVAPSAAKPSPKLTIALTSGTSPSNYGVSLTFTATVIGDSTDGVPTGQVTFSDNTVALASCTVLPLTYSPSTFSGTATCTLAGTNSLSAGSHTLTFAYLPDASSPYSTALNPVLFQQVNVVTPTIGVTFSPSAPSYGTLVTLTAIVTGVSGAAQPTGAVTFSDNGTVLGTCAGDPLVPGLTNSIATCPISTLSGGTHSITALYTPTASETNYNSATGPTPPTTITVTAVAPNVIVSSSSNPSNYGTSLTFTATVTGASGLAIPQGTVNFNDGSTTLTSCTTVTLSGTPATATCSIAGLSGGTHSITATYTPATADKNYMTATGPTPALSQVVNPVAPAITLSSSSNPSNYGTSLIFTATVTGLSGLAIPQGTVNFNDGSTTLTSCTTVTLSGTPATATCSIAGLSGGTHSITATYTPATADKNYMTATGPTPALSQVVNPVAPAITLSSSSNPSNYGTSLIFTATVTGLSGLAIPQGTVTFNDNGTPLSSCTNRPLSGTATCPIASLTGGTHSITSAYNPASTEKNYATVTGPNPALSQVVSAIAPTVTVSSSTNPSNYGTSTTFTATVTGPTGLAIPQGTVTFNDNGAGLSSCTNKPLSSTATCTINSLTGGTHSITATYNPAGTETNYITATGPNPALSQVVTPIPATVTTSLTTGSTPSNYGVALTFTARVTGVSGLAVPQGTVTFYDSSSALSTCTGAVLAGTPIASATCVTDNLTGTLGTLSHSIKATFTPGSDPNYITATSPSVPQAILPVAPGLGVGLTTGTTPSVYGTPLVLSATATGPQVDSSAPSGQIILNNSATAISLCSPPLVAVGSTNKSTAACASTSKLKVGTYTVQGQYAPAVGEKNYDVGSLSPIFTLTINPETPTVTINNTATTAPSYGSPVTLTITVAGAPGADQPTGTITIKDGTIPVTCSTGTTLALVQGTTTSTATCTVATVLAGGSHSFTAAYTRAGAETDYNSVAASPALTQTINPFPSTVVVTGLATPPAYGTAVTFTATVSGSSTTGAAQPTGTVAFTDNGAPLACDTTTPLTAGTGSSSATCTIATLLGGSHSIKAAYTPTGAPHPDLNYAGGASSAFVQTINTAIPSVTALPATGVAAVNQPVTFTAIIAPPSGIPANTLSPTGTVSFSSTVNSQTSVLCSGLAIGPLTGSATGIGATCTMPLPVSGDYKVSVLYSGDNNFQAQPSSLPSLITVGLTNTSIGISTPNPASSIVNQAVTLSAVVTPTYTGTIPAGSVKFTDADAGVVLCPAAPLLGATSGTTASASCTYRFLTAGMHNITAVYLGDANFNISTSPNFAYTVNPTPTTVALVGPTISAGLFPSVDATQTVTYSAIVTPQDTGAAVATGRVAFFVQGQPVTCTPPASLSPLGDGTSNATCAITFSTAVSGNVAITAMYVSDGNFSASTSSPVNQPVLNFTPSVATSPTPLYLTQGLTNTTDTLNASTIIASIAPVGAFSDQVVILSCQVDTGHVPASYATGQLSCAPTTSMSGVGALTLAASALTPVGQYTLDVTLQDASLPALQQTTTFTVNILNQPTTTVTIPSAPGQTANAQFNLASPLSSTAILSCPFVIRSNGTKVPPADVGLSCTFPSGQSGQTTINFTIQTAAPSAQADFLKSTETFAASLLAAPVLFLLGIAGRRSKKGSVLLCLLGVMLLLATLLPSTGCGSGGFKQPTSIDVADPGSYSLQIVSTDNQVVTPVALIPVLISR